MPDQDTSNRRRGRKATRFAFSDEQREIIDSYIPAFEKAVRDLNPGLSKSNDNISKWKTNCAETIMDHDLFQDIEENSSETRKKWLAAVRAIFSNHYSYNIVRKSTANPTTSSNVKNVPSALPHLRRALVTLTGDLSARDIFVDSLTVEEIEQAKKSVRDTEPSLVGGALRNAAIAQLWQDADHDHWDQQKVDFLSDTLGNQSEFPLLIAQSLQDVCNSGRLGSILLQLSYGFRGADDGILSGTISTGYDAQKRCEFNPVMKDNEEWPKKWEHHLDLQLPRRQIERVNDIPRAEGGIPILPTIDVNQASMGELVQVLQDYYTMLWDYSHKSIERKPPSIPWIDICDHPDRHYDKATFDVPVRIRDPKEYLDDPTDVFPLLKFLSNTASRGRPFHFLNSDSSSDVSLLESVGKVAIPVPSPLLSGSADSSRADLSTSPPSSSMNNAFECNLPDSSHANHTSTPPPSSLHTSTPPLSSLTKSGLVTHVATFSPDTTTSPNVAMAVTTKSGKKKGGQTGLEALAASAALISSTLTLPNGDEPPGPVPASRVPATPMSHLNVTLSHVTTVNTVKVGRKKNSKGGKGNKTCPEARDGETPKVGKRKGGKGNKSLDARVVSTMTSSANEGLSETSCASTSITTTSPAIGPVLAVVGGPKRKRTEVETGPQDLGPRKRKATKRARGIEYNESTPSDEERRNEVAARKA